MAEASTRAYRAGQLVAEGFDVSSVADQLLDPDVVVWVGYCSPEAKELHDLADALGFHELAVEDALSEHQRPKVDFYEGHLFLSCHALSVDQDGGRLLEAEINAFVGDRWMVTVRKDEQFPMEPVLEMWDRSHHLTEHGVAFLLYGLLDVVVDGYFDVATVFDDYYDDVSEGLFADTPLNPADQRHWFRMRRALVRFHRLVVPMRELVSGLIRREHDFIGEQINPYFQDLYDHVLRVSESTESLRDLVATIVETNLSLRDYRQNQVMKNVTSWAAIVAVPTLITGFYGMNVPYPGFERASGAWAAVGLIVVMSGALWVLFKRRGWL